MNKLANAQPIKPQHGNVRIQAFTMLPAMFHFTSRAFLLAPTPIMALVEQWLVETGMPVSVEIRSVMAVLAEAATPWYLSSLTMSMATDLIMRLPPISVPSEIAAEHRIISHSGKPVPVVSSMPKLSMKPRSAMDINF